MGIDLSSEATMYAAMLEHAGHDIEIATYGDEHTPWNVAIECVTCYSVLIDADNPETTEDE